MDPLGWRPAGGQWNKKQASLCRLANCCSRFSAGPLAAGVTSGFQTLVGNRLLLAVDFETAVFHDKESIAAIVVFSGPLMGKQPPWATLACRRLFVSGSGGGGTKTSVLTLELILAFRLRKQSRTLPPDTPPTVHTHRRADLALDEMCDHFFVNCGVDSFGIFLEAPRSFSCREV